MNMASGTYYDVLGVEQSASSAVIKSAYQQLVLHLHPDKAGDEQASKGGITFRQVQEAWDTLRDPALRTQYDEQLAEHQRLCTMLDQQQASCSGHVSDELRVDEMAHPGRQHQCRCGGVFFMPEHYTDKQLEAGIVLSCDSCSLRIRVMQ